MYYRRDGMFFHIPDIIDIMIKNNIADYNLLHIFYDNCDYYYCVYAYNSNLRSLNK